MTAPDRTTTEARATGAVLSEDVPVHVRAPRPGWHLLWWGVASLAIYHLLSIGLLLLFAPALLYRTAFDRKYRSRLSDRFGRVKRSPEGSSPVWVHGVSVGEVKAAATLIAGIRKRYPERDIVVSTTTSTGQQIARELYPDTRVIYYPIDWLHMPGRALDRVRPMCVLLMELEVWPNFLQACATREIPLAVVSGRISESSFRGYRWGRWLLPQLHFVDLYCMQIPEYRDRLLALKLSPDRVIVTGNLKYDGEMPAPARARAGELREWLTGTCSAASAEAMQVVVCGSTHGEEDVWVADALESLGRTVRIVTVPRHPDRAPDVVAGLRERGFQPRLWSELAVSPEDSSLLELGAEDVVVVDAVGQLEAFYGACDIAFVGGSLVKHGGQNMLEPVALGKPVVFGPHTSNFRTDVELLLNANGAARIESVQELAPTLERLLSDPDERAALASRGQQVIFSNQGATERTLDHLKFLLEG